MLQFAQDLDFETDVDHAMGICLRACELLCCDVGQPTSMPGILTARPQSFRFTGAASSSIRERPLNVIPDGVALLRTSPASVVPDGLLCSALNVLEFKSPGTALLGLSTEAICQVASRVADGDVAALEAVAEALRGYPNRAASRAAAEFASVQQSVSQMAAAGTCVAWLYWGPGLLMLLLDDTDPDAPELFLYQVPHHGTQPTVWQALRAGVHCAWRAPRCAAHPARSICVGLVLD